MTLIGYWPLNEESGSTAYDYSRKDNHGSLENSPTQGRTGVLDSTSYRFDSSNDECVSVGDISIFEGLDGITLSAWVRVTGSSSNSPYNVIAGKSGSHLLSYQDDTDEFLFRIHIDGAKYDITSSLGTVLDNGWFHVLGTWNGQEQKLFVNGREVASQSVSGSMGTDDNHFFIASLDTGSTTGDIQSKYTFDGNINEVRIYNHALTKQEIQYLHQVSQEGILTTGRKRS